MTSSAINLITLYTIIKKLVTPFNKTEAYKRGIIDENGKVLRSSSELSSEEKRYFTYTDILVFNLKKLLAKIPGGSSQIATYAAAMALLKESNNLTEEVAIGTGGLSLTTLQLPLAYNKVKKSKFGSTTVFDVQPEIFEKIRKAKPKFCNYKFFGLDGDDRITKAIKQYSKDNPSNPIIVKCCKTGRMRYLKYGSK